MLAPNPKNLTNLTNLRGLPNLSALRESSMSPIPFATSRPGGASEAGGEFIVRPSPAETTRDRKVWVRALLKRVEDAADHAGRSGEAIDLTIRIRPVSEAAPASPALPGGALDKALAAARARGVIRVAEILNSPEMLSARDFAPRVGMSHETVNQKRRTGELLGLRGATRGFRFPIWQITPDGLPLPGLRTVFETLGGDPWTVYRFLLTRHDELAGDTALDALKTGRAEAAFGVARNISAGVFA